MVTPFNPIITNTAVVTIDDQTTRKNVNTQIDQREIKEQHILETEVPHEKQTKNEQNHTQYKIPEVCGGRIDIVWTYVNGSDPNFIELIQQKKKTITKSRYREYGTMQYSMRSAYANVPYATHWYLVVQSKTQIPSFLNQTKFNNNDEGYQLHVIYHDQIFKKEDLPNFNSASIESNFANIPGLSECFIYLNDDFFIHSPAPPSFFIKDNGLLNVRNDKPLAIAKTNFGLWTKQTQNSNKALDKYFGYVKKDRHYPTHNCYFFRKSVMKNMSIALSEEFETTNKNSFRKDNDLVIPFIHNNFVLEKGLGEFFFETPDDFKFFGFGKGIQALKGSLNSIKKSNVTCYCLNDFTTDRMPISRIQEQADLLYEGLGSMYPVKTPFEY
ncbi:Glycosyltransferase [Entamoeba marina]